MYTVYYIKYLYFINNIPIDTEQSGKKNLVKEDGFRVEEKKRNTQTRVDVIV